jgi:cytoskeleton protein RodZ
MNEKQEFPAAEKAAEPLREAVQNPKTAREARGLSLNDVFNTTRISMINLMAVENEDFKRLPPSVYARDFIRKYAGAIGVDEKPLLARYERYLESLNPPRQETEIQKPWPETGRRYRFLVVSLAAVIAAGILVYALFLFDQSVKTISPVPPVETPPAVQVRPGSAVPAVQNQMTAAESSPVGGKTIVQPTLASAGKMYHLVIEALELTWVRITEDRNPPYQVLLKPGDKIERMASEYFQLDIGNAGGINLAFQGKPMGNLGKRGQILHMRLPEKTPEKKAP